MFHKSSFITFSNTPRIYIHILYFIKIFLEFNKFSFPWRKVKQKQKKFKWNLTQELLTTTLNIHMLCCIQGMPFNLNLNSILLVSFSFLHTYITRYYNPSVRIFDLVSHTAYIVCVNFIHKWRATYSLKSTPNYKFFEKLFIAIFHLLSEFLPEICWEDIAEGILSQTGCTLLCNRDMQ